MSTTTDLTTLKINYLTQAQYEEAVVDGDINSDEIYMTPAKPESAINLFEPTFWGRTVNQVTYTFDGASKTYAVSGTANANTSPTLGVFELPAGTYKLLGLQTAGASNTFRLNLYNNSNNSLIAQDKGDGAIFTLNATTVCKMALYINSGVTLNISLKPMVTKTLSATMSDYVPYMYDADALAETTSKLKMDLDASRFTGDKASNDNVGWLYDVAQSWMNNNSSLWYDYDNNLFWDTTTATGGKYPISCSIFVSVMIFGITFELSKYNSRQTNAQNLYGYTDEVLLNNLKNTFDSDSMLRYFIDKGYAFVPSANLGNVRTGDILYYDLDSDNNNYQSFMGIDHSAIYAYRVSDSKYAVWEVGNDDGAVVNEITHNTRKVVLAVRVPFKQEAESKRRVTLSVSDFSAPVSLASLFNFKRGNLANMWKVYVLGKAYAKGGTMSSIYMIRTNASGVIGDCVPLYEGTGANVRKINSSYQVYDESGDYNQAVTIVVEWLG